jgi:DNA-binding beta-propeller fold protein YncE
MRQKLSISTPILVLLITAVLPTSTASGQANPYTEFMGQRFFPRITTMDSLFGVGFDPVNRNVLSIELRTECGTALMSNETADNGVAWDPVTQEFWFIGNARDVYHYVAGVAEVIFSIPENFDVPGEGPATLDRPEGLAIDMNHVYVVDAGDGGVRGEVTANEWFKFTRTGAPVKSSASTDFQAELQPHFDAGGDCVVDGLTWIPPGSPYGEGLFLMAIEHSGIQVLDDQGMFVDRLLWPDQGLTFGAIPTGFAGIDIDPLTGRIYLVDNGGKLQVWEPLDVEEPMTLIYGSAVPRLHQGPTSPCDWDATYEHASMPSLAFGLTHRDVDGMLWTMNFNTGEMFALHPLGGQPVSMGPGIVNSWGMAYDDERDVFYAFTEVGDYFYAIDATTLQATQLPNSGTYVSEIAFNSDDKHIYGMGFEDPNNNDYDPILLRFDRDTAEPTIVGLTVNVSGMTYDRNLHELVAITNGNGGQLYAIDPATAQAQLLSNDVSNGWEGLAAAYLEPTATAVEPVVATPSTLDLRAFPNPLGGVGSIAFRMAHAGPVRASVVDLAGRRVLSLFNGTLPAGPRELSWNGRDADGRPVANGVYFIQLATPWERTATKLTVLR